MKKYNAKLIRDFVEANKIEIKTVHLGMKEDWRWTNDLLYDADNGGYQFDLGKRDIMVLEAAEQHPFAQLQALGGRGMMSVLPRAIR